MRDSAKGADAPPQNTVGVYIFGSYTMTLRLSTSCRTREMTTYGFEPISTSAAAGPPLAKAYNQRTENKLPIQGF